MSSPAVSSVTDPPAAPAMGPGCNVRVVALDFESKTERELRLSDFPAAREERAFLWIDIDFQDAEAARACLSGLGLIAPEIVEDAITREAATQCARYDSYVHFVVSGCRLHGRHFDLERVDCAMGDRFLLTIHKGKVVFLDAVRRDYHHDFISFAKSPSFLVYEIWDRLVDNYLEVQRAFEERVEALQMRLVSGDVAGDDSVFTQVSELGSDLLHFRKVVLPARSVLTDLSSRRSLFLSEATQSFLANMVGTLERVLQDLSVDREILSESLNLHMSLVTHRTNRVMNRLTVVSVVFLPLTFLCGVYGMNFQFMPELAWEYGYGSFWAVTVLLVVTLVWFLRRSRLI
jgi:magnesium transporter